MSEVRVAALVALLMTASFVGGCASSSRSGSATGADSQNPEGARLVKSRDGKYKGRIIGTPAPDSKFAKLEIGMEMPEIMKIMERQPDESHTYESGKRWIPFYYGNDARRMQALFRGEGCLITTGGNIWGGAGGDLIEIHVDPKGACYQP